MELEGGGSLLRTQPILTKHLVKNKDSRFVLNPVAKVPTSGLTNRRKQASEYLRKEVLCVWPSAKGFKICNLKMHFMYQLVYYDCSPIFNFFIRTLKPAINISVTGYDCVNG